MRWSDYLALLGLLRHLEARHPGATVVVIREGVVSAVGGLHDDDARILADSAARMADRRYKEMKGDNDGD
ncbi:MAG: hypothetical protein KatS3mg051_2070 [Anaerolineae bacterium]|nr:MAG: hypothetical protein KatS3mg051_1905 [Anaerolineae bacterium]GIV82716.1 MAG: hypothetical protein KatS3mg051_2070 [Anaerolineae bacterium]